MSATKRNAGIIAIAIVVTCTLGYACSQIDIGDRPQGPTNEQLQEQPDGDCDEGDKYESVPDPDCNGVWYGTPRPAASQGRKPATPARTPAPRRSR